MDIEKKFSVDKNIIWVIEGTDYDLLPNKISLLLHTLLIRLKDIAKDDISVNKRESDN